MFIVHEHGGTFGSYIPISRGAAYRPGRWETAGELCEKRCLPHNKQ